MTTKYNKICLYIGSLEGGGAERVVLNLANEFCKRDISVLLILRNKVGVYLPELDHDVKIVELGENNPFKIVNKIRIICMENNVKILLSVSRYNNILSLLANIFLKIRLVVREASTFDDLFIYDNKIQKFKKTIKLQLMKILYPMADVVIANSIGTYNDIKKHININDSKIEIINNPLISKQIKILSNEEINNEVFVKMSRPRIISVGRLVYAKNFEQLIKSFYLVRKEKKDATLTILGKGPQENHLHKLIKEYNLTGVVNLLGFVDNPYKYLKSSDVFVLSSLFEGFGNVLVEALSVGLPIVSNDCPGGPREILDNGKYGTLVPVNDEISMAKAILYSLNNKPKKSDLIKRSQNFSIDKISDKYLNLLFNLKN